MDMSLDANTFNFTEDMMPEMEEFLRGWYSELVPEVAGNSATNIAGTPPSLEYNEADMMAEMNDYFGDVAPEPAIPQPVTPEPLFGPSTDPEVMAAMEEFFGEATCGGWTEETMMAELNKRFGEDGN
ncbi:hypothetical protein TWF718_003125 [Orbilia javanica]|uniref:Uncharacterized protein n=1 Tax=Orbilia javanica TaxID=47235 RepID=A0AAN8MPV7_9PEZI